MKVSPTTEPHSENALSPLVLRLISRIYVAVVWFCLSPEETASVSQAAGLRDGGINSRLVKPAAGSISWARHRPRGPVRKNKEAQPTPASRLST